MKQTVDDGKDVGEGFLIKQIASSTPRPVVGLVDRAYETDHFDETTFETALGRKERPSCMFRVV